LKQKIFGKIIIVEWYKKKPKKSNLDEIKNGGGKNHRSWVALKIHRKKIY